MPHAEKGHLLLSQRAGWRAASLERLILAGEGEELRLRTVPGRGRPLTDDEGTFGGLSLPTGLAVDARDRVYVLDSQAHVVKRFDPCTEEFAVLPCIGGKGSEPRQVRDPHGLAISGRGDLYVADTGNRRVQIFALKGLPLRAIWGPLRVCRQGDEICVLPAAVAWPVPKPPVRCGPEMSSPPACEAGPVFPTHTWEPWDIVLGADHRAYVSDRANGLIHLFDFCGRWQTAYSEEKPGVPLVKPTHLALDNKGRLYVVQEDRDYVVVLDAKGKFLEQVRAPEEIEGRFRLLNIAVDEDGNLCLSECFGQRVHFYCRERDGSYTYTGPCRDFEGLGTALAFDRAGNPLLGDARSGQVCRLEAQAALESDGYYYSEPLDSRIYRCPWHRILIRASIKAGTYLRVDTFTSEAPKTPAEIQSLPEARWATGQLHTRPGDEDWDCLIQSPPGRYLWLRLAFFGNGALTPVVQQVKVYYPRASSLQYLPAVYQQDPESANFLDQFLSIFDTIREGIADQIGDIARYFDPAATPTDEGGSNGQDFLSWLASWLGLTLERHWPEEKRRQLLAKAHRLYALRGTAEGLRMHVELYTGVEPRILEHFRLRRWTFLDEARLGDDSALWGREVVNRLQLGQAQLDASQLIDSQDPLGDPFYHYAHQFTIFIPLNTLDETQEQTLERIVELAKPAHTQGNIQLARPRFRVGVQAFVGVDTVIGRYPGQVIEGEGELGYDTVIGPAPDSAGPPTMQIGRQTRIGFSTWID
jgi:phage tail-like protein